ncbi:hypothetical protein BDW66DRAFT_151535 [Aspergillus desertorum]
MIKIDRTYVHPNVPRWSQRKVKAKLEELGDHHLYGQIRENPETWACGRIAGVGDTVFKLTPNFAQGANLCIESSAALANSLQRPASPCTGTSGIKPTEAKIRHALSSYQDTIQPRIRISDFSYSISRVHPLEIPLVSRRSCSAM